ncbi:MAG TPA: DUF3703 domain-containing protein [Flavobacterium sp.]|nr:DUF3703 domain-containing protein [Flavobacterium sp.]
MRVNTVMPKPLKVYYQKELNDFKYNFQNGNLQVSWNHLERAHVIGQAYPLEHSYVHWKMLQFGFKIKNGREVLGQIPRLLVGGIKSFVGHIPVGNTGGSNIPPLKSLPIKDDILEIFENAGLKFK